MQMYRNIFSRSVKVHFKTNGKLRPTQITHPTQMFPKNHMKNGLRRACNVPLDLSIWVTIFPEIYHKNVLIKNVSLHSV